MNTTKKPNAIRTRNEQFDDIDRKIADLKALRWEYARKCKGLGPDDWSYTGRGGDLDQLQHALAVALGEEG